MALNPNEDWQCQTCFQHFSSDKELREHIESFQSRALHLFAELQKCFAHSDLELPHEEDCGASDDDNCDGRDLVNDNCEKLICPHPECEGKPRTEFREWKYFVRHYTIHVPCHETCAFCGNNIYRVRKYVTHIDNCKARKDQRGHQFLSKQHKAIERRRILSKMASKQLELKLSTIAGTSDEGGSSQDVSSCYESGSRKRALEIANLDPENTRRKRRTEGAHLQDIQDHPASLETRSHDGRVLISNMMNPVPQEQAKISTTYLVTDERAPERHRLEPQQVPGNLVLPGVGQYYSFSFVRRNLIENLPEPFRTGMKTSNLWRKEKESGGLAVTNCLSIYLPETGKEDAVFVVRVGYRHGFNIFNLFGFGDSDIPGFECVAEEARN